MVTTSRKVTGDCWLQLHSAQVWNPERFSTDLDPKILATLDAAWITKPAATIHAELAA